MIPASGVHRGYPVLVGNMKNACPGLGAKPSKYLFFFFLGYMTRPRSTAASLCDGGTPQRLKQRRMTVAAEPGAAPLSSYGSASEKRKDLAIAGLVGPSQGSADALQRQRGGKHPVAMTAPHPRGITVTPSEVGAGPGSVCNVCNHRRLLLVAAVF